MYPLIRIKLSHDIQDYFSIIINFLFICTRKVKKRIACNPCIAHNTWGLQYTPTLQKYSVFYPGICILYGGYINTDLLCCYSCPLPPKKLEVQYNMTMLKYLWINKFSSNVKLIEVNNVFMKKSENENNIVIFRVSKHSYIYIF